MARYIDADKLKEECYYYDTEEDLERYVIKHGYADVVPKSEVEKLVQDSTRLGQENETLKDNNEHLAVMLEEAKAEVGRLQAEKDALIKNYDECMKDYASEIFAEIEEVLNRKISRTKPQFERLHDKENSLSIWGYKDMEYFRGVVSTCEDVQDLIAELKKKYTEGYDGRV